MPPKESAKKSAPQSARPPISDSSLLQIPEGVIEGFQERLETGVIWTLREKACRLHKDRCSKEDNPPVPFTKAFQKRLKKSILNGFINSKSGLTFEEQWELNVPITIWDVEKFATDEGKICFQAANSITDDLVKVIWKARKYSTKEALLNAVKEVEILRLFDAEMTHLDSSLLDFNNLSTLNLCGNFIANIYPEHLPPGLRMLELQANGIRDVRSFADTLPQNITYIGLARNLLSNENIEALSVLPQSLTVLDLSDNDIYDIEPVLDSLACLPNLVALQLAGNPCSFCLAYAKITLAKLPRLLWLDNREVLPTDRPLDPFEPHPDDLRSTYFNFTVIRIMSLPQPPKAEKGTTTAFFVELELPFLDKVRREFLMFRRNESLEEMLPPPEDEFPPVSKMSLGIPISKSSEFDGERSEHASDIYNFLIPKNLREIHHYTTFESTKVQWNKIMTFPDPAVKIFCPDLRALRDTFRTEITVRVVYSVTYPAAKPGTKKSSQTFRPPTGEYRVTLATVKCALRRPDWSQAQQHFHWEDTMGTDMALHWGDGNLAALQYTQGAVKVGKGKSEADNTGFPRNPPDNITCHLGFGVEMMRM